MAVTLVSTDKAEVEKVGFAFHAGELSVTCVRQTIVLIRVYKPGL